MATYETAHIDEIASKQWPHWIPIRHHFGIETFGMNAYRRDAGEGVVPEHDESASGAPELFYVATGHCTFSDDGEEIDAAKLHVFCTAKYLENRILPIITEGLAKSGRGREAFEISGGI